MSASRPARRIVPAEPTPDDLKRASAVVRRHLPMSPVIPVDGGGDGQRLVLKVETLQPTGSFKVRGAIMAVSDALRHDGRAHVVAASAGNHGLGIAWATRRLGATATIVVPETASVAKLAALERFPAELVRFGTTYDDAERHALARAVGGATFVSPYNDTAVIAGQATIGHELRGQVHDLTCVVVPVGGGGLASGIALSVAGTGVTVIGVGARQSPALAESARAGRVVPVTLGATIADGLAGNLEPGSITVDLVHRLVSEVVLVSEEEIVDAVRHLARDHGLVVEGAGAAAMAAVLAGRVAPRSGTTAVLVTGRNIDLPTLARLLS